MPKISIVMPVYNAEPFLDDAILSVMEQSFGDWELICVNDGSTVKTFRFTGERFFAVRP